MIFKCEEAKPIYKDGNSLIKGHWYFWGDSRLYDLTLMFGEENEPKSENDKRIQDGILAYSPRKEI